jgi:hypothetical protein
MPVATAPIRARRPFPERPLRGVALVFLSLFQLQLKVLSALVRFAIAAVLKGPRAGPPARPAA